MRQNWPRYAQIRLETLHVKDGGALTTSLSSLPHSFLCCFQCSRWQSRLQYDTSRQAAQRDAPLLSCFLQLPHIAVVFLSNFIAWLASMTCTAVSVSQLGAVVFAGCLPVFAKQ
jgi:hypothetical protein